MPHFPWSDYGIIGIVVGVLFFILWRMLVWVMAFVREMTKQHASERESWKQVIDSMKLGIELHNQGSIEARKIAEEAHKYQREEHIRLADQLSAVCASMATTCASLKQTEQALGRLNGYKKGE